MPGLHRIIEINISLTHSVKCNLTYQIRRETLKNKIQED